MACFLDGGVNVITNNHSAFQQHPGFPGLVKGHRCRTRSLCKPHWKYWRINSLLQVDMANSFATFQLSDEGILHTLTQSQKETRLWHATPQRNRRKLNY
jgi:hypothetical protein